MKIFTTKQVKLIEKLASENGLTEEVLMKNAGESVATFIEQKVEYKNKNCVVLCGLGNNGGDGYILAKKLYNDYANVVIVSVEGDLKNQNVINARDEAEKVGIKIFDTTDANKIRQIIENADILVDAIYGTGFVGQLPDEVTALNILWKNSGAVKFAVDMPTGMVADTGDVDKSCFVSDFTVSLIGLKPAHIFCQSRICCGKIAITEIGIEKTIIDEVNSDYNLIDEKLVWEKIKMRDPYSHKGDYGKLINISGSQNMRGAAALSTLGALRVGTGVVTLASVRGVIASLTPAILESKFLKLSENSHGTISSCEIRNILDHLNKFDVCLIGCGLGVNNETKKVVMQIIKESQVPLVIDADGINIIAEDVSVLESKKCKIILTPHLGEMSKLLGLSVQDVIDQRYKVITEFANRYHVTVVLKDYDTVIVDEAGKLYVNICENPGLSKGGSGDVLAGMIAGLVAQGIENAPTCGVYLHSKAAQRCLKRKSQYGMLPSDMLEDLCQIFLEANR